MLKMQSGMAYNVAKLRQAAKACVVLSPLLGMTWMFGILSVTNAILVFQYIFTILNSLQVTYELLLSVAFVAVRVLTNFAHVKTGKLDRPFRKWNPPVLPNWESWAWPNCLPFHRRVSLAETALSSTALSTRSSHKRLVFLAFGVDVVTVVVLWRLLLCSKVWLFSRYSQFSCRKL